MKYLKRFKNISDALQKRGGSPNLAYVPGSLNRRQLVYTNLGNHKEIRYENHDNYIVGVQALIGSFLTFTALGSNAKVKLKKAVKTDTTFITLQYRTGNGGNYGNWTNYNFDYIYLNNVGDAVLFKGNNNHFSEAHGKEGGEAYNYTYSFDMGDGYNGKIAASGCINSMLDATLTSDTLPAPSCFYNLFASCTNLVTPPELPSQHLTDGCYKSMFFNCTSMTSAPILASTDIAPRCYTGMFLSCTALTTAPALPATLLYDQCYLQMFLDCNHLTSAPVLPAMSVNWEAYSQMFYRCTSLQTAPELPATNLGPYCYSNMFYGCTGLRNAPSVLPATTVANGCYYLMFCECGAKLSSKIHIKATSLVEKCCYEMLRGDTGITLIEVDFSSWNDSASPQTLWPTYNWHYWFGGSGTFTCPTGLRYQLDDHHMPWGWNIVWK